MWRCPRSGTTSAAVWQGCSGSSPATRFMFSALQLFAGTFSDRTGARRAYGMGMILFTVASAACACSPTLAALIVSRILQGIGAAMITPASLALIREAYHDATQRGRAIVCWGLGGSVAAAAGPVLGGLLTEIDWRLIFLVNLPVGAVARTVLSRVGRSPLRPSPFDWIGQITAVLALASLTYGIIEGASAGYGELRDTHGFRSLRLIAHGVPDRPAQGADAYDPT